MVSNSVAVASPPRFRLLELEELAPISLPSSSAGALPPLPRLPPWALAVSARALPLVLRLPRLLPPRPLLSLRPAAP